MEEEKSVVEKARKLEEGARELRVKDVDNLGDNGAFLRADMIDFKTWDLQLEKHLSRAWSRDTEARNQPEEWEIDLAKLDIKNAIAHGTYGTVYKGVYDCQDVAGEIRLPRNPNLYLVMVKLFSTYLCVCVLFLLYIAVSLWGVLACESVVGLAFYAPLISGFSITRLSSLFQCNALTSYQILTCRIYEVY